MLHAIWAQSRDGVIGDGQTMPWHIPEDLQHFKRTTLGDPVVMGRGTWESLPKAFRPLPGRENFVVSSQAPGQWSEGAKVISFEQLLEDVLARPMDAWIIGGGQLYAATLPLVDRVVRTLVDVELRDSLCAAAVCAPELGAEFVLQDETPWQESSSGLGYRFQWLQRSSAGDESVE